MSYHNIRFVALHGNDQRIITVLLVFVCCLGLSTHRHFTIFARPPKLVEAYSYDVHEPIQPLDRLARRANYESDQKSKISNLKINSNIESSESIIQQVIAFLL